jgi:hypothetical protein
MGEKHMNQGVVQFLATIIEQFLYERDMQLRLAFRAVGDNGSVLEANFNEGAELVVLTKHCENNTFMLPMKITVVSQATRPRTSSSSATATSTGFTNHRSRKGISAHAIEPLSASHRRMTQPVGDQD